jgi:hypothetical protein
MTTLPLGIDIAKSKFNACLLRADGRLRHKVFPNTADRNQLLNPSRRVQRSK